MADAYSPDRLITNVQKGLTGNTTEAKNYIESWCKSRPFADLTTKDDNCGIFFMTGVYATAVEKYMHDNAAPPVCTKNIGPSEHVVKGTKQNQSKNRK